MRALFLLPLLFLGCSHKFDDVRPGEGGLNSVVVKDKDDTEASREAMRQARAFCKDKDKEPAIVKESREYYGDVSEDTYKKMRRAGKAAKTISGGVISGGEDAAADYAGAGYQVRMEFRCGPG